MAAEQAIAELADLTEGTAGVVVVTPDGSVASASNSETMQTSATGM